MNAIQKALSDIKFTIPYEILSISFSESNDNLNQNISLDERILSSILRPRVLVDANIVGGTEIRVSLNLCRTTFLNNREFVVEVPKSLTGGRSIMTLLSLVSNVVYNQTASYSEMQGTNSTAMNMLNNMDTTNVIQTSRLELISDNVLIIQDPAMNLINGVLRCTIENSSNLENINPRSFLSFSKLCVLATKAYIYNKMLIKLDKGFVYGGHELGSIKDVIDTYSDSEEAYQEYLNTVWREVSFINDSDAMSRYVESMIGNTI